jgi:hypothetical protein
MPRKVKKAKSLVEINDSIVINRRNICLIQSFNNLDNQEFPYHHKITLIGGIYCEFDSKLNTKQLEKLCDI